VKSVLDPTFRYTPAVATDVRATFERIRREQAEAEPARCPHDWYPAACALCMAGGAEDK
jgi:hypothetical protein